MRLRRWPRLLIGVLMGGMTWAVWAQAPAPTPPPAEEPPTPLVRATAPVTIDGKLDEPCWQKTTAARVDYIMGRKEMTFAEQPRMAVKYAWDPDYLYIAYETFERNLSARGTGQQQGPKDNRREGAEIWLDAGQPQVDVVEFFISFGSRNFLWEIHHNALNQFNDVWCIVSDPKWELARSTMAGRWGIYFAHHEYIEDDPGTKLASAVQLKPRADGKPSTVNQPGDEDTGYTAEIRLPWGGIGVDKNRELTHVEDSPDGKRKITVHDHWKVAGMPLAILAVHQDGDDKERYTHSSPKVRGNWFHMNVENYPRFVCTE